MAKTPSKSSSPKKPAAKRSAAKSTSTARSRKSPAAPSDDPDFELRSLQREFEDAKVYEADEDEMLEFYRQMLLIRRFEEKAGQLYGLGLIGGFCHLYIGQEAVAIGLQSALDNDRDSVITGYRDHGHMLAYGIDPKVIMAELTGRQAGISKGKGGSMHMFSTEHKFYGGHGIVGAQVPLGGGLAFAHQYNEDGGICLAYFGDGAANQGQVYETFNMAALWNLPIVFVVEDNQYAMGTSTKRSSAETRFHRRGTSFRIPGMDVDGMNVLEVRAAAEVAFKHVREGKGPVLMELNTYRYRGHSMSDPAKYRTREEVQEQRDHHDPIERLKKALIEQGRDEAELKAIDKEIRGIVAEAADFAENSPEPDPAELYTDVLVEEY
ncbi:pyruvate dehydrogenase E1 component alpha subunit [Erythrobacter litoralis]|uniref:Pyruvate dehydrogenase E1 component subunit alpha n=1 Tax=Erythrobacter litoralis TaxID=39960 RepID=A0A074NMI3_9SPHN|nr:pyruvate dehydrogenase (acetyl-transferring) E1 component subunit alpha [Erythrobacter litoralis]AOL23492.1 pyruvate dehydrogenase E1 component alpha subunit [Erythrobacter litoralis]KEO99022.1 pyruvate dehydrogenase [Erythrobacter litoralis]MEE4339758.1 pyruvate dehydrogenase (acetyl-transferring) E1 component subunit alpha [Erythrobacter sp.]